MPIRNKGELLRLPWCELLRSSIERVIALAEDERIEGPQLHVQPYRRYRLVRPSEMKVAMHVSV